MLDKKSFKKLQDYEMIFIKTHSYQNLDWPILQEWFGKDNFYDKCFGKPIDIKERGTKTGFFATTVGYIRKNELFDKLINMNCEIDDRILPIYTVMPQWYKLVNIKYVENIGNNKFEIKTGEAWVAWMDDVVSERIWTLKDNIKCISDKHIVKWYN